jgi:hypothetical protein
MSIDANEGGKPLAGCGGVGKHLLVADYQVEFARRSAPLSGEAERILELAQDLKRCAKTSAQTLWKKDLLRGERGARIAQHMDHLGVWELLT